MEPKFLKIAVVLVLITGVLAWLFSNNFFYNPPLADIASQIEGYPNATSWNIYEKPTDMKAPGYVNITFGTEDPPQDVLNFYKEKLAKDEWAFKKGKEPWVFFTKGFRNIGMSYQGGGWIITISGRRF